MTIFQQQAGLRRQLEARGITDGRVLDAIERTRRDLFVPEAIREMAYDDTALPIAGGQTISQPYMVALMTQELALRGTERVLEVGTGSGYQAAILSQLCAELVTVERLEELSRSAEQLLTSLGYRNIVFKVGDGSLGCPEHAPYDGIIVTAGAPGIPDALAGQLAPRGRLVVPIGDEAAQELVVCERSDGELETRSVCGCRFVKLIGAGGWPMR
jgi:protein-L-isoaspartate(D-aspartate) O-methyltransferase